MKFSSQNTVRLVIATGLLAILSACAANSTVSPQASVKAPELPPPAQAVTAGDPPSALSYGMVTGRVKKGVTTQQELIELFGGPSTMTTDKEGDEVWMYDKTASTTSGNYAQSAAQADKSSANAFAAFLGVAMPGIPAVLGGGAGASSSKSESAQVSQGASSVTHSVRTITFIIKFNPDKTVKDYAVRQASY